MKSIHLISIQSHLSITNNWKLNYQFSSFIMIYFILDHKLLILVLTIIIFNTLHKCL